VGTLPLREGCQVRSAEFYIFSILTIGDSMRGIWTVSPFQSSRRSFEDPAFVMRCERRRTYTCNFFFGGGAATPCASPPPWPSIFSDYSFLVHHPANRNDRHILAHAMTSDFTVAWQHSQREQHLKLLHIIKLLVTILIKLVRSILCASRILRASIAALTEVHFQRII
jgi:hypothetical protein